MIYLYGTLGIHGTAHGAQGGSRVGRATTETTETTTETTTTNIPTPTTPHAPAPRDEISRSGYPNPLTLIMGPWPWGPKRFIWGDLISRRSTFKEI